MRLRRKYIPSPPLPNGLTPHSGETQESSSTPAVPDSASGDNPNPPQNEEGQIAVDTAEQEVEASQDEEILEAQGESDTDPYSEMTGSEDHRDLQVDMDARNQAVHGAGKVFPSPSSYDEVSSRDNPDLDGMAPWFDRGALEAGGIVER